MSSEDGANGQSSTVDPLLSIGLAQREARFCVVLVIPNAPYLHSTSTYLVACIYYYSSARYLISSVRAHDIMRWVVAAMAFDVWSA
jgi:hypothetical protein